MDDHSPPAAAAVAKTKEKANRSMVRTRPYYSRRCKKVCPTNIESLPDELLSEILVRVPIGDVYDRARVVCRRWSHIIHCNAFVNAHLHRYPSSYGLLLSAYERRESNLIYVSETSEGQIEMSELSYKGRTAAWASCNGLVMDMTSQTMEKNTKYILNPTTKQAFHLPRFDRKLMYAYSGIGYCAASMEYKVVWPHAKHLAILTLGVDSSWRHVRVDHLSRKACILFYSTPLITEGFMHWTLSSKIVLTLNVESEVITETHGPDDPEPHGDVQYLSTGRCLTALIRHNGFAWDVWEMKPESGEWREQTFKVRFDRGAKNYFRICCEHQFIRPIGWVKYPEVLACRSGRAHTCTFYDLRTQKIISTVELPRTKNDYFNAFPHMNTMVKPSDPSSVKV